ncbi:MAG TPA: D-alanine--D-alanine ligase [Pirellulales bacterium]|nr:D-alanine--D-alanine ligase [Pirellulales bacterium]
MYEYEKRPWRVVLLAGGDSAEREVSLTSGRAVAQALSSAGHHLQTVDPAATELEKVDWSDADVCFIALHGGAGEDGQVQARLEQMGISYTGSGPRASQLAMSKSAAKERFLATGVPTADFLLLEGDILHAADNNVGQAFQPDCVTRGDVRLESLTYGEPDRRRVDALGFPLVVKPDRQGSSLGVGFAQGAEELRSRVAAARQFDSAVLIERWIDGREFTVAVLGRRPLPLLEIVTPRGLFDYEAKYEDALTEYRFEHGLPAAVAERLVAAAVSAAEALDTSGLVRVDLMLDRGGQPWVLEVNTSPGLTDHSLAPKAAAQCGMDMVALCSWMIRDALAAEVRS